jgi:beta-glucuronidase
MKHFLSIIFSVIGGGSITMASAATLPLIQNAGAYESLSLNGAWNYIVDVQEEGYYDYRMNPSS